MLSFLALGDSYTIGEGVSTAANFPHQTAAILSRQGIPTAEPLIIARTGWTTGELLEAIREQQLHQTFSFVTLLIGVNNQYRGLPVDAYHTEMEVLLNTATNFANGHPRHVFVLSIPDWGVTPFAEDRNRQQVAKEIDAYNNVCREAVLAHKMNWVEITDSTRANGQHPGFLAEDGLHPSGKEYAVWAQQLAAAVGSVMNG